MADYEMPPRQPGDGHMGVERVDDDHLRIYAVTEGQDQAIKVSDFNAWRLFGALSLMLGLPLPKNVSKSIKM